MPASQLTRQNTERPRSVSPLDSTRALFFLRGDSDPCISIAELESATVAAVAIVGNVTTVATVGKVATVAADTVAGSN